jgi:zinc/manganese transport system permease protein
MNSVGSATWDLLAAPFADFAFMRRALVATWALSLSAAPLGVLLTLKRMSLMGDALSHAVLPGVAIGYLVAGLSLPAMALGGAVAGLLVAGLATAVSRWTPLQEDASLAAIYLMALAWGITLMAGSATPLDLLHILFGSALGVDEDGLLLVASVTTASVLTLAALYRGVVLETAAPVLMRALQGPTSKRLGLWHALFLVLVVLNLVAGYQTLGTLMAVGLMMLPAVSARLWHQTLPAQLANASAQAALAGFAGLLLSFHLDTPSGPTIIGCAGVLYILSLLITLGRTSQ